MKKEDNPFYQRYKNDPEGVIKDLLAQSTRQAKEIHDRGVTIEAQAKQIEQLEKKLAKLTAD